MKKTLLLLALFMCISYASISQKKYYWAPASSGTASAPITTWNANWNEALDGSSNTRTTNGANIADTLIFDGNQPNLTSNAVFLGSVPADQMAQLKFVNNVNVTIISAAAGSAVSTTTTVVGSAYGTVTFPVSDASGSFNNLEAGDYVYNGANSMQVLSVTSNTSITTAGAEPAAIASSLALSKATTWYVRGNPGLSITSGSTLNIGASTGTTTCGYFLLKIASGATGSVSGNIIIQSNAMKASSHARVVACDAGSLVFNSGGTFSGLNTPALSGSSIVKIYLFGAAPIGTGSAASSNFTFSPVTPAINFADGSTYTHGTTYNHPWGAAALQAANLALPRINVVSFSDNANYIHNAFSCNAPYFIYPMTYPNLIITSSNLPGSANNKWDASNIVCNNLTFSSTAGATVTTTATYSTATTTAPSFIINGSLTNNLPTLVAASLNLGKVVFTGTNATIGGTAAAGYQTFTNLTVADGASVTLLNNINVSNTVYVTGGTLNVAGYTVTGSGSGTLIIGSGINATFPYSTGPAYLNTTKYSSTTTMAGTPAPTAQCFLGATVTSTSNPNLFPTNTKFASYAGSNSYILSRLAQETHTSDATTITVSAGVGKILTTNVGGISASFPSFTTLHGGAKLSSTGNATAGAVEFNGSSAQITGILFPQNITNLTISNPAGVTLSSNDTVKGTLTVSSGTLTTGATNFSLGSSASATLAAGTRLIINGGTTDFNGRSVTVQANASSTAAIINIGTLSNATNVTLQQWVTGQRGYRILSNPFSTRLKPSTVGTANGIVITGASDVKTYNTATNTWTSNFGIDSIPANTPYSVFIRGLASEVSGLTYSAGPTAFAYNVTGTLNGSSVTLNQDNTSATAFTIAGNPFAAPVNSSALTGATAGTPYYVYSMAQNNSGGTRVKAGGWVAASSNSSTTTPIPMMGVVAYQAGTGASSTFSVASTSINTTDVAQTGLFGEGDATTQLELQVAKDGVYQDKLFVRFDANSTEKGTERMDLPKLNNDVTNIYTLTSDKVRLAVDARKGIDATIPVGITSTVGKYTFTVASNNFVNASNVYLVDKLTNTKTALEPGATYSFEITSDAATQGDNRFELGTTKTQVQDVVANSSLTVKVFGNVVNNAVTVQVRGAKSSSVQITVVDMQGKLISNTTSSREINNLSLASGSGMYLIKVTDGESSIVSKVVKP